MTEPNPYRAPQAAIATQAGSAAKPGLKQMLFSAQGRIRRRDFWLWTLATTAASFGAFGLLFSLMYGMVETSAGLPGGSQPVGLVGLGLQTAILAILYPVVIWITTVIQIKRWHDRDKSGWWVLLGYVPVVGLWALVETGFLEGTRGPNRFGPDPKADDR